MDDERRHILELSPVSAPEQQVTQRQPNQGLGGAEPTEQLPTWPKRMKVALLCGGPSAEHEVSLASAASIGEALAARGHELLEIRIGRDGRWRHGQEALSLQPAQGLLGADLVFPALHGRFGEDGIVQGVLEALRVPYVGSDVAASALCIDKVLFKDLMRAHGLPQVSYAGLRRERYFAGPAAVLEPLEQLGMPLFVKPSRLGSSLGIVRVQQAEQLAAAIEQAFAHDEIVIVEAAAAGIEVECGLLGGEAPGGEPIVSTPGQVKPRGDWYDYAAKYEHGGMELVVPAPLPAQTTERLQRMARQAFLAAGCRHLARADFFVDGDQVLLNELNTLPGFTTTSVYPKLMAASGIEYPTLLERLCHLALAPQQATVA